MLNILIKGCGVAGLTIGWELLKYNVKLSYYAPQINLQNSASWLAGGMLAPFCEREAAPKFVQDEGAKSIIWWQENFSNFVNSNGTLVVAASRDLSELKNFANKTTNHITINKDKIADLELNLSDRFTSALFYEKEAHLDPRQILLYMKQQMQAKEVSFFNNYNISDYDYIIDCTGINYAKQNCNLRGVRGEMLLVKCNNVFFKRNIRFLHPRIPLYIIPRENNIFMIGATMIESENSSPILARSMVEMLNAAYTIHPEFANAQILEANVGIRPAFPDNLPKIEQDKNNIYVNGLYRHGFLLAPYLAKNMIKLLIEKV